MRPERRAPRRTEGSLAILDALLFLLVLTSTLVFVSGHPGRAVIVPSSELERVQAVAGILPKLSIPGPLNPAPVPSTSMRLEDLVALQGTAWLEGGVPGPLASWLLRQVSGLLGAGWGFAYELRFPEAATNASVLLLTARGDLVRSEDRYVAEEGLGLGAGALRLTCWLQP